MLGWVQEVVVAGACAGEPVEASELLQLPSLQAVQGGAAAEAAAWSCPTFMCVTYLLWGRRWVC